MTLNKATFNRVGRESKLPIGDFGSRLWHQRLATFALKELKYCKQDGITDNDTHMEYVLNAPHQIMPEE